MTGDPESSGGTVSIKDFKRLDIRIGKIVKVEVLPKARSVYKILVDIGGGVTKQTMAGLISHYTPEELQGMKVVFLSNLEPKKFMGDISEGMLLAAESKDKVVLLTVDREIGEGAKVC